MKDVATTHACIMEYSWKYNAWYCVDCRDVATDERLYNAKRVNNGSEASLERSTLSQVRS